MSVYLHRVHGLLMNLHLSELTHKHIYKRIFSASWVKKGTLFPYMEYYETAELV